MRNFFTFLLFFGLNHLFAQCTAFNNLQFLSGTAASGEVLNLAGTVTLSNGTPFQYNTINDNTGAKLMTDNSDQKDFTLSGSSFAGALGSATAQLNPSTAAARIRFNHGYNGAVTTNNPGTVSCNTFTLIFNSNMIVNNASFNFSSLNTDGIAWEYSVIQMLDPSGNPFSLISGLPFTPGTASQYTVAGSGYSGSAGVGNYVAASTGTVTGVGTITTASGTVGADDNMNPFEYGRVGLAAGTQIGGITLTTCLEDVRGTNNGNTNFTSSLLDFTISGCIMAAAPAPVEFLQFSADEKNKRTKITFTTASETNNDYFTIERSGDGKSFEAIGEIKGAGNSSRDISYTFTDEKPLPGINYYRIKQTDYDGQFSYSEIRSVRHKGINNVSITPRTTEGRLDITTELEEYTIAIYNAAGQEVKRMIGMSLDQSISIETLHAGVYFVKINSGSESETVRIVKI